MLYGVHPHHPEEAVEQDIKNIDKFLSPSGRLMLAFNGPTPVGIGCLKRIHSKTAEIKRMYVDPSFRGYGTGRAILDALLKDAQEAGYKNVFLDNPKFMEAAHSLYRSFGFKEIPAYPESEIPEQFRQHLLFMGLNLNSLPATK